MRSRLGFTVVEIVVVVCIVGMVGAVGYVWWQGKGSMHAPHSPNQASNSADEAQNTRLTNHASSFELSGSAYEDFRSSPTARPMKVVQQTYDGDWYVYLFASDWSNPRTLYYLQANDGEDWEQMSSVNWSQDGQYIFMNYNYARNPGVTMQPRIRILRTDGKTFASAHASITLPNESASQVEAMEYAYVADHWDDGHKLLLKRQPFIMQYAMDFDQKPVTYSPIEYFSYDVDQQKLTKLALGF